MITHRLLHSVDGIAYTEIYINIYRKEGNNLSVTTHSAFSPCSSGALQKAGINDMYKCLPICWDRLSEEDMLTSPKVPEDLGEEGDRSINYLFSNTMFGLAKVFKQPHLTNGEKERFLSFL